ncbi:MAG: UDP-N-acetylmuramoyl-tripeptide--D-alanyl-D-alanine ligase [Bacteroides sp.]|nr:UDP-N-acetylmuramoyl-tripeptide--D-alanyl-D-alanine ligase [Bacteroides sp.]MCM1379139.1 UDP-N-acetylmuramoyl-tripeptide--D-alanyl-D-alanine ligase [Bacteroides sp.]MCM1445333.1 UDP-N-acetylmuramoyl-tripeptide--D-alanyl-D-alanine ligase [Prevotella sp.]
MIISILAILLGVAALALEFGRTLMTVQQNSYRIDRYWRYLKSSAETTSVVKLLVAAMFFVCLSSYTSSTVAEIVVVVVSLILTVRQLRLHKNYKHPVVWTPRVRRIFAVMFVLAAAMCVLLSLIPIGGKTFCASVAVLLLLCWFGSPAFALWAVWLLQPVEKYINQGYINDARRILASMPDLKVIGITGSYGKTSTKHYLYRILAEEFTVCMTPGSFNTTLGVVRTIREHLKPFDRIFICEMGAKQVGDIKEICDLVHPEIGIVTAVGPQHLESFKSIENVQRTKFELIDALPQGGLAVVNDDFEYVANRPVENVAVVRYGIKPRPEVQFAVGEIEYSASGTHFTVLTPDGELKLHTRLVGECNVSNLVAAVIVALHLGVEPQKIAYAVEQIEQVEHRLSIKRIPGGLTILDDAFNSNPSGSAMALDVLKSLTGGKRIVITPGMIELGDEQQRLNTEFGRKIGESADVAIVVGQYNREAILAGLEGSDIEVHTADTFTAAQALLQQIATPGSAVLYENDLPDTFK